MATAVSFLSEGGFDYLELIEKDNDVAHIVMALESKFGKAWHGLEVVRVKSTEVNTQELRMALEESISSSEQDLIDPEH